MIFTYLATHASDSDPWRIHRRLAGGFCELHRMSWGLHEDRNDIYKISQGIEIPLLRLKVYRFIRRGAVACDDWPEYFGAEKLYRVTDLSLAPWPEDLNRNADLRPEMERREKRQEEDVVEDDESFECLPSYGSTEGA